MEAPKPTPINSVISDCMLDTIIDLKDLEWYQEYISNNPINFDSNGLRVNSLRLGGLHIIISHSIYILIAFII